MPIHLINEIEKLKKLILSVAAMVESNLRSAMRSVNERDEKLAQKVIEADRDVDRTEVDVEEECLKILALHQPVAHDLRYIIAVMKINHDLERIGDLTVNIGERAQRLAQLVPPHVALDLEGMAKKSEYMVNRSIDAFINIDLTLAREIWFADDEVDLRGEKIYEIIREAMTTDPENIEALLGLLHVSRSLERIADHATNIAKDVIYIIDGDIVRHRSREYREKLNIPPTVV